jgi:hypothetical protein
MSARLALAVPLLLGLAACKSDDGNCTNWPAAVKVNVQVADPLLCTRITKLRVKVGTARQGVRQTVLTVGQTLTDCNTSFVVRLAELGFVRGDTVRVDLEALGFSEEVLATASDSRINGGDGCQALTLTLGPPALDAGVDRNPAVDQVPAGCEVQVTSEADSCLVAGNPGWPYAHDDVCNVSYLGAKLPCGALMRFQVPAKRPSGYQLELSYAHRASACSDPCGDCDHMSQPGLLLAYLVPGDWDESTATWNDRSKTLNIPWTIMQEAATDLGPKVASADHLGPSANLVLKATDASAMDAFLTYSPNRKLSFLVKPGPGSGVEYVAALRETGACGAYNPPTLRIFYCP